MHHKVRTVVICVVACVWAANFLAPIMVKGYEPPSEVHVVFLAVIGFLGLGYRKDDQSRHTDGSSRTAAALRCGRTTRGRRL